ncbi:MAG: VWA domain-containing protein [Planctomycetaceae bacterium]|nr:VWA domain-containing protein [Planctomycetaceae bacterium]
MSGSRKLQQSTSRRGAVLVLMAFLLPVVLILCFFSVNLAYMLLMRTELRVATDAAARAAGSTFSVTNDEGVATAAGQEFALLNPVGGQGLVLDAEDVSFGRSSQPFPGARYQFVVDNGLKNSTRVTATAAPKTLFASGLFYGASFAPTQSATVTSSNVDICLVLDRSSSMKLSLAEGAALMSSKDPRACQAPNAASRWKALSDAVDAFLEVLESTGPSEHVAMATYASNYSTPCKPATAWPSSRLDAPLSGDLNVVRTAMNTLNTSIWGGNTEIHSGVIRGTAALTDPVRSRPNAYKVMIVLTDGNYTADNPIPYAAAAANAGIIVHAVTFSDGANQEDMRELASVGGGSFYHAPDAETLEAVFRRLAAMSVLLTD